jgi:hypothetical protein
MIYDSMSLCKVSMLHYVVSVIYKHNYRPPRARLSISSSMSAEDLPELVLPNTGCLFQLELAPCGRSLLYGC